MKDDIPKQEKKKSKSKNEQTRSAHVRWIVMLVLATVMISGVLSLAAEALLNRSNLIAAFCILLAIVLIGVVFDVIGVAVTAADTKPFHAMAAHRVSGAREALNLLRKADRVSSFCNDVIGDICGVISGAASASIAALAIAGKGETAALEILLAALVSGLTVGGKAAGKHLAISKSTQIAA